LQARAWPQDPSKQPCRPAAVAPEMGTASDARNAKIKAAGPHLPSPISDIAVRLVATLAVTKSWDACEQ
jgi:hypothetical protein